MTRTSFVWAIGLVLTGCSGGGGGDGAGFQADAAQFDAGGVDSSPTPGSDSASSSGGGGATSPQDATDEGNDSSVAETRDATSSDALRPDSTSDDANPADSTSVSPKDGAGPSTQDGSARTLESGTIPPPADAAGAADGTVGLPDASGTSGDGASAYPGDGGVGWDQVPGILSQIVSPSFPSLVCDITQYGGVGDGTTDNTTAFAQAVADCAAKGGGQVLAPLGTGTTTTYFTGPIELLSNIELNVPTGVTIRFSTDPTVYANPLVETSFEGSLLYNFHPLVWAHDATNVGIIGGGTLDANSTTNDWYSASYMASPNPDSTNLRTQNVNKVPITQRQYGTGHYLRPSLIEFMRVTNILFQDFTAAHSPFWTIHPVMSSNITAKNIHSIASQPNTDGFDPESCVNVLLDGATIQVGDDPIAIKAGRDVDGRTYYTPTENVVIQNCTFNSGNPGHGGSISVGSEMSAGVRNVYAQNNTFTSIGGVLAQAIYLKASANRGGFIEDFYARNLTVDSISQFMFINGQYSSTPVPAGDPVMYTTFNNINVDTATVNSVTGGAFGITGASATTPVTNVSITNVTIKKAGSTLSGSHYSGLSTSNDTINGTAFSPAASAP
ncbi:MAG: glycosyl hydrolase family 28 protein [Polyangiaceae bacterium]|jgi:polygalacturonase